MHYSKEILNVKVDFGYTYEDVLAEIEKCIQKREIGKYICTTNPEFIMDAQKDLDFRSLINSALLSVPDGAGILYAEAFLKRVEGYSRKPKLPYALRTFMDGLRVGAALIENPDVLHSTITGVELTNRLAAVSAEKKYNVYLLGGSYGDKKNGDMAQDAADALKRLYPGINIVGATSKFSRNEEDDIDTVNFIQKDMTARSVDHIDILLVAYNHIYQDKWIARNAHKIPAFMSIGVGRTFALLAGHQRKDPLFMEKNNLSWLYRLITQPSRFVRVFKAFPYFPINVYLNNLK